MITLEVCWGRKTENLTTKSASSFDGRSAKFEEVDNFLQFAGPEDRLQVLTSLFEGYF